MKTSNPLPIIARNKTSNTYDILCHLAFDNTAQANIISTASNGEIILANKAACKLLGYSKSQLLTKSTFTLFDVKQKGYKKMQREMKADRKSMATVTAITKGGSRFPCEISTSVFLDKGGVEKSITIITDLQQRIMQQKSIDFKKAQIVARNIASAKAKQKTIDVKNKETEAENVAFAKIIQGRKDLKSKKIVLKNIALAITKQKIVDVKNKKLVVSNQKEAEERLAKEVTIKTNLIKEYNKRFKLIFNSASDVLYDNDLITGTVVISDAYEYVYGYKINNNMTPMGDWISHIHAADQERVQKEFFASLSGKENQWISKYRFLTADGVVVNVKSNSVIIRDEDGRALQVIGSMQDIDKQTELEEQLAQEIKLREKHIAQASEEAKDTERSDIGKELHDNVNQLLGASKMYIDMAKHGGTDSQIYLTRSSEYTLAAIEEIRKLSHGLTTDTIKNLGLRDAIEILADDMMEVNPIKIICNLEGCTEKDLNYKFKLNLFRVVQEQLNNVLKHAKATEVQISLVLNKKSLQLTISDNGVGFDTQKKHCGIGLANIKSRAAAYNGTAHFYSQPGEGCVLKVTCPL